VKFINGLKKEQLMQNFIKQYFVIAITVIALNFPLAVQAGEELKPGSKLTLKAGGVEFTFCYIPAGSFMMGSPESEKGRGPGEKLHKVILRKPFYMLENEVTQEQYAAADKKWKSRFTGAKLPVENFMMPEGKIVKFFQWLSKTSGKKFRVPTEAEWEYACRAGTTTPFNCGKDLDSTMANIDGYYPYGNGVKGKLLNKTTEVKQFKPNTWGLYDMHGNVAELCMDFAEKGVDLYKDGITDPGAFNEPLVIEVRGTNSYAKGIPVRLNVRGGGYNAGGSECRSAAQDPLYINIAENHVGGDYLGFRLVLIP